VGSKFNEDKAMRVGKRIEFTGQSMRMSVFEQLHNPNENRGALL